MAWFSKYSSNPFVKNFAVMLSGNGLALVIPFLIAPLISRIYTPEDFAGFELFVKIAALIAVVSALRFELAIIIPKEEEEASSLVKLSVKLVLITTLVAAFAIIPFREVIGMKLGNSDLPDLLWLLPLMVFGTGIYHVLTQYALRLKRFNRLSSTKISGALTNNGFKYIAGLSAPIALSLVWGQIIGVLVPIVDFLRIKSIRREVFGAFKQKVSSKELFRKYRDFPLVSASHGFFDEGQKTLLLFIISAYYGEMVLGLFAFGLRYVRVPLQVFGVSLSQVLNEKWARQLDSEHQIKTEVVKTGFFLFGIGIIPFALLFFFGEELFAFVFGSDWTRAGEYSEIMAVWLFLNFIISPMSFLPVLLKRQRKNFLIAIVGNVITLSVVFGMAIAEYDFTVVLYAFVFCNVILYLYIWLWYIHIAGKERIELT
jgi:O-antigen/teichoic acid export membrane protein